MSDEAKIAWLKEKIKEAQRSERRGTGISISGLVLTIFSFFALLIRILPPLGILLFFFGIAGGIAVSIFGMAITLNYAIQGGVLREQRARVCLSDIGE